MSRRVSRRASGRARVAALSLVVALLGLVPGHRAVAGNTSPRAGSGPAPVTAPVTPVLSLRRLPKAVASVVGQRRLTASLTPLLADAGGPAGHACLSVRDPEGRTLFSQNAAASLIPASNMKLETATAVLGRLGGDSHFTTEVRTAALPSAGTVAGDLWLIGAGDPLLATADYAQVAGYQGRPRLATSMETLADRIVATGVRQVEGRVMGDESRYDTQRYLPSWSPTYASEGEIGPQSALTVNGGFVAWRPKAVPAPAPATNAAAVLTALLKARGVAVGGEAGEGRAPPSPTLTTIDSPSLADVVGEMLAESDNLAAELVVKELGARFAGAGTTAAGLTVARETLSSLGLGADGVAALDGSGLDRGDRLTCDALQATLSHGGEGGELGRNMSVAGRNGTLTRRFAGTPAAGRIRAKTGSLTGVVALSGWADIVDGRSLQFALMANELAGSATGTGIEDRVATALASWPQAPAPGDIGPLAPSPASASSRAAPANK